MKIRSWQAVCCAAAIAATALIASEPRSKVGKAGDYYDFQYPQGWKYQPLEHSGVLDGGHGVSFRAHYIQKLYDAIDGGEVLRKLAGQMPELITKKLQHKARQMGGGVAHTWILKVPKGEPTGVVRAYVVPLPAGGAAVFSGVFPEEQLKRLEPVLDSIAATVKGTGSGGKVESVVPSNAAVASRLVHGVAELTPGEAEAFARDWTSKIAGKSWYSDGRIFRFHASGRYDSPQGPEGTWRVVHWEGRIHVALSTPMGQPVLIRCHDLKRVL